MRLLNHEVNSSEDVIALAKQIMADNTRFERLQIIGDLKNEYYKRTMKINSRLAVLMAENKPIDNNHISMVTDAQYVRELYEILESKENN